MAEDEKRLPGQASAKPGHLPNGDFAPGNQIGKGQGNPYAKKVAAIRAALFDAVTPADISEVVAKILAQAKAGDMIAARELLDRLLGKPKQTMEVDGLLQVAKLYSAAAPTDEV